MHACLILWTRQFMIACTILAASCGTRVGNPKQPDGTSPQSVVIPKMEFAVPKAKEPVDLNLQSPGALASGSDGIFRLDVVIQSLNALVDNLNETNLQLGVVLQKEVAEGTLVAQVNEVTDPTYSYEGIFCVNGSPFYYARWNKDGSEIQSVRDFMTNPFTDADVALEAGSDLRAEIHYLGNGMTLDSLLNGIPKDKDILAGKNSYLMDYARIQKEGDHLLYNGVGFWSEPDADRTQIESQRYMAGRIDADGLLNVLANDKRLSFCETFDETKLDQPGWCFGYKQYPPTGIPSLLTKDDVDTLWEEIKSVGIAKKESIKAVTFPETAVCPLP